MGADEIFKNLKALGIKFEPKGNKVVFKNPFFRFGDDPEDETPEELLITTVAIEGNYGEVVGANDVASFITALLNK